MERYVRFEELDEVLFSDKGLGGTVVNVVCDDRDAVVEYWVELHEGYIGGADKVVIAAPNDVHPPRETK